MRHAPHRDPASAPYPRWSLECGVKEEGSGLDARGSFFTVDGQRRPSEWDSEQQMLRWRPRHAPMKGPHRYTVTLVDRAGNASRISGGFVLD